MAGPKMAALDQRSDDAGKDAILVHCALEVMLAAASASADHRPGHLEMPIAKSRELLVDLDA